MLFLMPAAILQKQSRKTLSSPLCSSSYLREKGMQKGACKDRLGRVLLGPLSGPLSSGPEKPASPRQLEKGEAGK